MHSNWKSWRAAAIAVLCGASIGLAAPPAKLALTGARIIPVNGKDIESGTVLMVNGKIAAIGADVQIPYDAMEVDVTGKVIFPGMIDAHSARGLDVRNENLPVTPFLDVYDAIDPSRLYFEDALRDGITTIHTIVANNCVIGGLSRALHPIGLTPDEMTLQAPVALKISAAPKFGWDRMVQMATLRETFYELADYLGDLAEQKYEESLEKKDEDIDVGPEEARKRGKELIKREDYDDKHRNLVLLTEGKLDAFAYCGEPSDVGRISEIARKNGFFDRTTLVLGPRCHKAVDEIKKTGRPVVLEAELIHRERNAITGDIKETFVPKIYHDRGIEFSLLPNADSSLAERYLNYQAARCVREGIGRKAALRAITINPAKAMGIDNLVGSIEPGKVGNLVVLSGDPLDFNTVVDHVFINGIHAYDRTKDARLQELLKAEPAEIDDGAAEGDAEEGEKAGESKEADSEETDSNDQEMSDTPESPESGSDNDGDQAPFAGPPTATDAAPAEDC
ncbi:MAG: amidohydrolase family protein [Phycisphaerae bacterium]